LIIGESHALYRSPSSSDNQPCSRTDSTNTFLSEKTLLSRILKGVLKFELPRSCR